MIEAPSQDKSSLDGAAPGAANGPWFKFGLSVEIVADWQPPETYAVWLLNPSVGGGGGWDGGDGGDGGGYRTRGWQSEQSVPKEQYDHCAPGPPS